MKMSSTQRDFNTEAATWDENPRRVQLARDLYDAICESAPLDPELRVLDFGCGTGLLTLLAAPHVKSVLGVDTSHGMLGVLEAKAQAQGVANVRTELLNVGDAPVIHGEYDRIVSTMTFHHVEHVETLLRQFHERIAPGGQLYVADLDSDEGQFHEDPTGVFHDGFDRAWLRQAFMAARFEDVRDTTAAHITKPAANGTMGTFSVFLMVGRRS